MNNRKEGVGKGIRALLDTIESDIKTSSSQDPASFVQQIFMIPLEAVEVNPFQPRVDFDQERLKELADSILVHGVIQPITVRRVSAKKFQLIAGERRLKASRMAGLKEIPAFVRMANDQEMLEMALIENTHREDLNALEVAINYKRLIDECQLKQEELATRVGKDRSTVTNYLRLLKLPPTIQQGIKEKTISMGHARALINVEDPVAQLDIFNEAVKKDLSVRKIEQLVQDYENYGKVEKKEKEEYKLPAPYKKLQEKMASHFSTRVTLRRLRNGRGEIIISYFSDDDLERLTDLFGVQS